MEKTKCILCKVEFDPTPEQLAHFQRRYEPNYNANVCPTCIEGKSKEVAEELGQHILAPIARRELQKELAKMNRVLKTT